MVPVWTDHLHPVFLPSSLTLSGRNWIQWTEKSLPEAHTGPEGSLKGAKRQGTMWAAIPRISGLVVPEGPGQMQVLDSRLVFKFGEEPTTECLGSHKWPG